MTGTEKRRNLRINSRNLISYVCIDENNEELMQGIGRTLNVSEGGILLETYVSINEQDVISLTVALEDDLMDFKGKIVYCKERDNGHFEAGIEFTDMDDEKLSILQQFITLFQNRKKEK